MLTAVSRSTITLCGRNEKNEDREISWTWKIFVPVVIVVMGLKLLLAGVFGNKPDKMGRDMKKIGKAPKCVRAFLSPKEHELLEEWFDGAELVAVLCESGKCLLVKVEIDRQ